VTAEDAQLLELLKGGAGTTDMGPAARSAMPSPQSGMRPAPKSDVDLGIEGGPITAPVPTNPLRQAFPRATARSHAEDPIEHDPLAGAIVQSIPAAGAGALGAAASRALGAGPLMTRVISNAAGGAASDPEHPIRNAAIGAAIPAVPGAIRAADNAIGEAALNRVTSPATSNATSKGIGTVAGTLIGGKVGGVPGAAVGGYLGNKAGQAVSAGVDKVAGRLAERHLARTAAPPAAPQAPPLAPLEPQGAPPAQMPPGLFGKEPLIDEITGEPVTGLHAPPVENHATVGGGTVAGARPGIGPGSNNIEARLKASIEILSKLREASANGTLTPQLEQEAIDSGISPATVYHAIGDKARGRAAVKREILGE
jgi:hypothetical protein